MAARVIAHFVFYKTLPFIRKAAALLFPNVSLLDSHLQKLGCFCTETLKIYIHILYSFVYLGKKKKKLFLLILDVMCSVRERLQDFDLNNVPKPIENGMFTVSTELYFTPLLKAQVRYFSWLTRMGFWPEDCSQSLRKSKMGSGSFFFFFLNHATEVSPEIWTW